MSKYVANFCKCSQSSFTEYEFCHLVALLFYVFETWPVKDEDVRMLEPMTIFVFWILLLFYLAILCLVHFCAIILVDKIHDHFICFVDRAFDLYKWSYMSYLIIFFALNSTMLTLILQILFFFSQNISAHSFICDISESLCCDLILFYLSEVSFGK